MLDSLGGLAGTTAYVVVALLAALEASAFVGLFVPGELALLAGGYIAQQGHASLGWMMAVAAASAVVGDSLGYEIGRRFGPALQRSRVGRTVGAERWARAEAYLEAKGGRAVLAGRFVGVLRALVPAVAGAARMPYGRFLAWNAAGALVWAPGTVLIGYAAGSSYRRVERYAGRAGLVLLGAAIAVAVVVMSARWIARHPDTVRRVARRQLDRPRVASLASRYDSQLAFLGDRLRPGNALGLALTVQLAVLGVVGWVFGSLLQDVLGGDDATRIDRPVVYYLAKHRASWLTTAMRDVSWLGSTVVLVPLVVVVGVAAHRRTRRWTTAAHLALSLGGAVALYDLIKPLVGRPRPHVGHLVSTATGYAFPSGHATQTVAVAVTIAMLGSRRTDSWPLKVSIWSAAALVSLAVGFSRIYLGVHWPTDVLAGYALGGLWAAVCALAIRQPTARGGATVEPCG
ncbi:MAG: bifunctional DedA family/phosphatase PAP2 family protein [Actinobacteria bacterium]|nr:bifunctional DedA family/phosphatase PAP2 family protein [Actinomycetota bacterium]